ncbi:Aste57867_24474 [Aphanomyces stellatus]|uniref:Aste57867_24474 protein n=1 Tax=Aphanomyces stellatus TaxID=120398 RepID=A0A485LS33_9STRA|nr:hypothetical protein As57867_024397 [Aphanomyces stellatus]VFU01113.1 Aste57867_24474 [Aphanomyces stellatus]
MASTAARQQRCRAMTANGAVFLESSLRNVNYQNFRVCWGAAFDVGVAAEVGRTQAGQTWLTLISSPVKLPIADEVAAWSGHGIKHFTPQWQNFKTVGLNNYYDVKNAFGSTYPFTLQYKLGNFRLDRQTTYKMYWGLANDWIAVAQNSSGIGGLSLVRSSPTYAFTNQTAETVMLQNGTLALPFGTAFTLIRTVLGPFGSVDMQYIPCPAEFKAAVHAIYGSLQHALASSTTAQVAFNNINLAWSIYPCQQAWSDINFVSVGGSPLCPEYSFASASPISAGYMDLTSWEFECFLSSTTSYINPSRDTMIASVVLAGVTSLTPAQLLQICKRNVGFVDSCLSFLGQTSSFVTTYFTDLDKLAPAAAAATTAVRSLDVRFMQYGMQNVTAPIELHSINTLEPTEVDFTYFAWIFLMDWAVGDREAVSFQGDNGTLALLTDFLDALVQNVNLGENEVNFSYYFRMATLYVTYMVITVALLIILYCLICRGRIEPLNLFLLGRVGAIVWIGRPLLFLRSLAAIGLLSTCALQLQTTGYISFFQVVQPPLIVTLLAANEVTWLVSVGNDIAFVVTEAYAVKYDDLENILVLVVTAIISVAAPVAHTLTIDKQCALTQVDFQVECTSGGLVVGDTTRLVTLIVLVFASNLVCYILCRLWFRGRRPTGATQIQASTFLYSGAKVLFTKTDWMLGGAYFMDRMSAVLNGILTLRVRDTIYGFDVKLWRMFHIDLPQPTGADAAVDRTLAQLTQSAFPLSKPRLHHAGALRE